MLTRTSYFFSVSVFLFYLFSFPNDTLAQSKKFEKTEISISKMFGLYFFGKTTKNYDRLYINKNIFIISNKIEKVESELKNLKTKNLKSFIKSHININFENVINNDNIYRLSYLLFVNKISDISDNIWWKKNVKGPHPENEVIKLSIAGSKLSNSSCVIMSVRSGYYKRNFFTIIKNDITDKKLHYCYVLSILTNYGMRFISYIRPDDLLTESNSSIFVSDQVMKIANLVPKLGIENRMSYLQVMKILEGIK